MATMKTLHEAYANIALPRKKSKTLLATMHKGFASNGCVNVIELYEKEGDSDKRP